MPVDQLFAEFRARCQRVRSGLDVGFVSPEVPARLRAERGGVWYSVTPDLATRSRLAAVLPGESVLAIGENSALPFDDSQFEVAVLDGGVLSRELVREIHRVLRPQGLLFFSVDEKTRRQPGYTQKDLFNDYLKHGFDVIGLRRPSFWWFGRHGHALTVCAKRKNWKVHNPLAGCERLPLTPFGKAPR